MREMMQRLNVVKCATSEAQKAELLKKGFVPIGSAGETFGDVRKPEKGSMPQIDANLQTEVKKKVKQEPRKKDKQKQEKDDPEKISQQKQVPEPGQGEERISNRESQPEAVQAGDGNA